MSQEVIIGKPYPEAAPPVEPDSKAVAIDTFNIVFADYREWVAPLLDRKRRGEPKKNFTQTEIDLVVGYELVEHGLRMVVNGDRLLTTQEPTYKFPVVFWKGTKAEQGTITSYEGIAVDPLRKFIDWKRYRLIIGLANEMMGYDTYVGETEKLEEQDAILFRNSKPFAEIHGTPTWQRRQVEAWIISQDPWRTKGDDVKNWFEARDLFYYSRRELDVPEK